MGEDLFGDLELPDLSDRLNVEGWKRVWALREIAFGGPRTGPVGALNLLNKRRATLEFLHVHHEDLQHAIELAGPNVHNAQETWHRVFRDAERAVLRQTPDAFPELGHLPPEVRRFVLWHRIGHLGLGRALRVPGPLPRLLGDQDGLFASACNQYRASMNHVADWAQAARADGPRRRGGGPAPGQPARGAHEPAVARRAAAAPRRLRLRARSRSAPSCRRTTSRRSPTWRSCSPARRCSRCCARTRSTCSRTPRGRSRSARWSGSSCRASRATRCSWSSTGSVEVMLRRDDGTEVNLGTAPAGDGAGRDVAAHRRAAQRDRARARGRARVRDRPPPVRADPGRPAGARRRARTGDGGAADAPRARCSSATTPTAPARASRAGSGACWRAPELAEQLQRVGAGGVLAERAHVARDRLRQRPAAAGRRTRAAATTAAARHAKVRSAAVKRSPHRWRRPSASRSAIASKAAKHERGVVGRGDAQLPARPARRRPGRARSARAPPTPGRPGCCRAASARLRGSMCL